MVFPTLYVPGAMQMLVRKSSLRMVRRLVGWGPGPLWEAVVKMARSDG